MTTTRRTLDILPAIPLLLTAQCLGVLGSSAYTVTVLWWLKTEIGSDSLLALTGALYALPTLLLGLWAGQLADRIDRKDILTFTPLVSAVVLGVVVLLSGRPTPALVLPLLLGGILLNVALTFEEPALLASFPELTEKHNLERVNALHQMLTSAGSIAGALMGGMLAAWGVQAGATVALFTALLGFLLVPLTRWPAPELTAQVSAVQPSFREVWQQTPSQLRQLLTLICLFIVLAAPMPNLLPALVHDTLQLGSVALGQLQASFSTGFVVGGLLTLVGLRPASLRGLGVCILGAGLVRLGLSASPNLLIDMGLLVIGGASVSVGAIASMTQLQKEAPAESRGALLGVASTLMAGAGPVGLGLATVLLPVVHTLGVFKLTGVLLVALGLWSLIWRRD